MLKSLSLISIFALGAFAQDDGLGGIPERCLPACHNIAPIVRSCDTLAPPCYEKLCNPQALAEDKACAECMGSPSTYYLLVDACEEVAKNPNNTDPNLYPECDEKCAPIQPAMKQCADDYTTCAQSICPVLPQAKVCYECMNSTDLYIQFEKACAEANGNGTTSASSATGSISSSTASVTSKSSEGSSTSTSATSTSTSGTSTSPSVTESATATESATSAPPSNNSSPGKECGGHRGGKGHGGHADWDDDDGDWHHGKGHGKKIPYKGNRNKDHHYKGNRNKGHDDKKPRGKWRQDE